MGRKIREDSCICEDRGVKRENALRAVRGVVNGGMVGIFCCCAFCLQEVYLDRATIFRR